MAESDEDAFLGRELRRTEPDYVVFRPGSARGASHDTGNEQVMVVEGPDGSLLATWTQMTCEGFGDHRVVFSRSVDGGRTWPAPVLVAGYTQPDCGWDAPASLYDAEVKRRQAQPPGTPGHMASWGVPLLSRSGRLYILYNQFAGVVDHCPHITGEMHGIYSDDLGQSWSRPQRVPLRRSPYDHPDAKVPPNWIILQAPQRLSHGRPFVGLTRWYSEARATPAPALAWGHDSVAEFMRFENIDDDPEPEDLRITNFAFADRALRVPHYRDARISVCQEPHVVALPDGRLMAVMRTMTWNAWYSLSQDQGETWSAPRPLLRRDGAEPIVQPICTVSLYALSTPGRYVLIHHGRHDDAPLEACMPHRQTAYLAMGEFRSDGTQPIWFGPSRRFMSSDGVGLGYQGRLDVAVENSLTRLNGEDVLWYPDRKFFVLGRRLTPNVLDRLGASGP